MDRGRADYSLKWILHRGEYLSKSARTFNHATCGHRSYTTFHLRPDGAFVCCAHSTSTLNSQPRGSRDAHLTSPTSTEGESRPVCPAIVLLVTACATQILIPAILFHVHFQGKL